jgi:galactokinase
VKRITSTFNWREVIDIELLETQFIERHGRAPRIFRAPGRVNLIGEHTDYNDGFVLPAAIDMATCVAASPRADRIVAAESVNFEGIVSVDLDERDARPRNDWGKYIQGVALILERAGYRLPGADLLIASDIPVGAGISSSAALEISVGFALATIAGHTLDGIELAKVGQTAEHEYGGVMSGIMDQFVSVHGQAGRALFLDCRSLEWLTIPLAEAAFVVCNTKTKHDLADGEYNKRRTECENAAAMLGKTSLRDVSVTDIENMPSDLPMVLKNRAMHVVTENARVLGAVSALKSGDLRKLGELINASHESLRYDFEVSCPELDGMVAIARRQPGVLGARMIGGGFGGCTINLMLPEAREAFTSNVTREYNDEIGIEPEVYDVRIANGVDEVSTGK